MNSTVKKDSQLTTKFFTKNSKFSIPDNPYSIPASSNPETFNSLIKSVLKESFALNENENEKNLNEDLLSTEFDFYINDEYINTSLEKFIQQNDIIKTESVIEIEYVERYPPPEPVDTVVVDDWVSSIRGLDDYILLGSYNNTVQIWNRQSKCLAQLPGHTGAVKAVCWVSIDKQQSDDIFTFLSVSQDQSLIQWEWSLNSNKVIKIEKCIGHSESVECVDVNEKKDKFISGSWDKMLKLWNIESDPIEEVQNKKSKSDLVSLTKTPLITLAGHTESISSCKWMDDTNVCTASWDHSIKLWDMFAGQETRTLKSLNKIFLSVDYSPLSNLIAAGLNDNFVRIYDPRSNEGNIVKLTLSSHAGWVSSVFWSRTNENMILSGSYDNLAKIWDTRNTKMAVFEMVGHEDKVLCVDWSIKDLILTGSADNSFKIFSSSKF